MTVVFGGPTPAKLCPACGVRAEFAGYPGQACPKCRGAFRENRKPRQERQ